MLEGGVHAIDDADGENQVEVLGVPVLGSGRLDDVGEGQAALVAADLDAGLGEVVDDGLQDIEAVFMHQQRLDGVADTGALDLGVVDDGHGEVLAAGGVDVGMAKAAVVLDDRDRGDLGDGANERLAAAGHDE